MNDDRHRCARRVLSWQLGSAQGPVSEHGFDRPGDAEVHVWRFDAHGLAAIDANELGWLSGAELERLGRIALPARREQFVRVRRAVRAVLGGYLGRAPAALVFEHGAHGKPRLGGDADLQFSLSHAGGCAVLAIAARTPLGIDVERVRRTPRDELALRLLGGPAQAEYLALPEAARDAAFAWAWAEREAFVKALGLGIGDGWPLAAALFAPQALVVEPAHGLARSVGGWVLTHLSAWPGFACVLCSARAPGRVELIEAQHGPPPR